MAADEQSAADTACGSTALTVPITSGGVAIIYNLKGVSNLNLSAATLAGIFAGKITKWNDPVIQQDNPTAQLPAIGIQTFHRSDGSGTSYNFTNYLLNDARADWSYGVNKNWPAPGGQGAKGSAGVAQGVKATTGGIGYFEQSYASQNNLPVARLGDGNGNFIELTQENTTKFLSYAKVTGANGDLSLSFDYANKDPNAYPNVLVTYEIVCRRSTGSSKPSLLRNFLDYTAGAGQQILPDNGYVMLPKELRSRVRSAIGSSS
jgi:phosphate transport system substrate-binding protein